MVAIQSRRLVLRPTRGSGIVRNIASGAVNAIGNALLGVLTKKIKGSGRDYSSTLTGGKRKRKTGGSVMLTGQRRTVKPRKTLGGKKRKARVIKIVRILKM